MRLVLPLLFVLTVLEFGVADRIMLLRIRDCDSHCSGDDTRVVLCCANLGYIVAGYCSRTEAHCYSHGTATTKIRDIRTENERLKADQKSFQSKAELFQDKLNVCERDHKKFVDSMARTKAIIKGIIAGKHEQ